MQNKKDPKKAAGLCMDEIKLDTELYRLGHTKVNFAQIHFLTIKFFIAHNLTFSKKKITRRRLKSPYFMSNTQYEPLRVLKAKA